MNLYVLVIAAACLVLGIAATIARHRLERLPPDGDLIEEELDRLDALAKEMIETREVPLRLQETVGDCDGDAKSGKEDERLWHRSSRS